MAASPMSAVPAIRSRASAHAPTAAVLLGVVAYGALIVHGMNSWSYDVWGALIVGPLLLALGLRLITIACRYEADLRMTRLLRLALVLKLCGAIANYVVSIGIYGRADAQTYSAVGAVLAHNFRDGNFASLPANVPGTGFIEILTGFVYTITGPSFIGGYLVFSWFGFWGIYFFYRGVVLAVPSVDTTRFAKLVFFLPSMLFWPSNIGKDAWVCLGIGITVWGFGRIIARLRNGFLALVLGLAITGSTRPNITAILFAAVFIGYLVRPSNKEASALGPIYKFVGVVGLLGGGFFVIQQAKNFFGIDNLSVQSVQGVINSTTQRTTEGGSAFHASASSSVLHLPQAAMTVLFRPYPWEAHNLQGLIAGGEGLFLLVLTIRAWPRLRTLRRRIRDPFVLACLVYTLEFVYAFSSFGNFGILSRERVQVFPFFLVLLSLKPMVVMRWPQLGPRQYARLPNHL
jgi:hypothetical protein